MDGEGRCGLQAGGAVARRRLHWVVLSALLLAFILIPFFLAEAQVTAATQKALQSAQHSPSLTIAAVVLLLCGDVVLPIPASVVSAFAGATLGWAQGGLVVWVGMMAGSLAGYGLGRTAGRVAGARVVGEAEMIKAKTLFDRGGPIILAVSRGVPVLAEAGSLAAGAGSMAVGPFVLASMVGNAAAAAAFAFAGARAGSTGGFLVIFVVIAGAPVLAWTVWRLAAARCRQDVKSQR